MGELPAVTPDLGTWHRVSVHRDCHVAHQRMLYSVPFALIGKTLWLRATDASIAIYDDYRLVASHVRRRRPGDRLTVRAWEWRKLHESAGEFGLQPHSHVQARGEGGMEPQIDQERR